MSWSISGQVNTDTIREELAGKRNEYLAGKPDGVEAGEMAQIEWAIDKAATLAAGADTEKVSVSLSGHYDPSKASADPAQSVTVGVTPVESKTKDKAPA